MSRTFLSYRRSDAAGLAMFLHDRLTWVLGANRVFMDIDSISLGADFADDIESAPTSSSILLVLIGARWQRKAEQST